MSKRAKMKKNIVIISGGFAGVSLEQKLKKNDAFRVTLVVSNNYIYFTPLLYQVVTGMLEVYIIIAPFRSLFLGKNNIRFRLGKLQLIDRASNKLRLSTGVLN